MSNLLWQIFLSQKYNDRTVLPPNFKAVGLTHAELHILDVKILDACTRPILQTRSHIQMGWVINRPCSHNKLVDMIPKMINNSYIYARIKFGINWNI